MRELWPELTFGDLFSVPSRNGLMAPSKVRGEGVRLVNMHEIFAFDVIGDQEMELAPLPSRNPEAWLLKTGDLLFARQSLTLAGAGKCCIVGDSAHERTFESHIIRVRLDESRAEPKFYYHYFRSQLGRTKIYSIVEQVAASGIRASDLRTLRIPAPPIAEQKRIAGVLGALDDLIETNTRIVNSCAELRHTLVNQSLTSAEGSQPLSELASFVNGRNFTKDASGTGRPVIRTPELRRGPNAGTIWSDNNPEANYSATQGDILFVWSGSLMVKRWLYEDGLINQHIFKVVPNSEIPAWLVYGLLEHQMPWFQSLAADKATTMGHIQRGHLDALVPMLSKREIQRLNAIISPLWEEELHLMIECQQLAATRDELLPLLFSGAVTVTEDAA